MSSPSQLAANLANARHSTGPRTDEGKSACSKNAVKSGLFAASDYIRSGEEPLYAELAESLRREFAPAGVLEHAVVNEILRAMWRLRRCGEIEADFASTCPDADPMQDEATAKLQLSVDRARAHSHRLLHRCTAELRRLHTERHFRNEYFEAGTDISHLGLCDLRAVAKSIRQNEPTEVEHLAAIFANNQRKIDEIRRAQADRVVDNDANRAGDKDANKTVTMPATKQTQTARNARCPCGSGQKYKRCCGTNAIGLVHAA